MAKISHRFGDTPRLSYRKVYKLGKKNLTPKKLQQKVSKQKWESSNNVNFLGDTPRHRYRKVYNVDNSKVNLKRNIFKQKKLNIKLCEQKSFAAAIRLKIILYFYENEHNDFFFKLSFMCMQTSQQVIIQLQKEENTNILQVKGYNLMYHKFILHSMKWVKKLKRV